MSRIRQRANRLIRMETLTDRSRVLIPEHEERTGALGFSCAIMTTLWPRYALRRDPKAYASASALGTSYTFALGPSG